VTGFFYDKRVGKVYSTLTKIDTRYQKIHYHIGLEQVYSSKYEVGALLTRFRVSTSTSTTDYVFMCHEQNLVDNNNPQTRLRISRLVGTQSSNPPESYSSFLIPKLSSSLSAISNVYTCIGMIASSKSALKAVI
jgi:uncharacterized protein YciW